MGSIARSLYVGAAQMTVSDLLANNLSQIVSAMSRGAARGLEVLVFPEAALTGYSPVVGRGRQPDDWQAISEALDRVAAKCAELGLWVALGSEAWTGDAWANRAYVFSDAGALAATYDKVHLTRSDRNYYVAGTGATAFDLRGIRVGLQICYDARFPEGYRELLHQGAEVILQGFYGAGGDTWKVPVLSAHLRSRAAESGCYVVACNVAGPLQIVTSQIVDPKGLILAEANQDCEELISAELDIAQVHASEIRQDYLRRCSAGG